MHIHIRWPRQPGSCAEDPSDNYSRYFNLFV